jgi:hypothetical protein
MHTVSLSKTWLNVYSNCCVPDVTTTNFKESQLNKWEYVTVMLKLFQIYKAKLITNQKQKEGGNTNIEMLVIKKAA